MDYKRIIAHYLTSQMDLPLAEEKVYQLIEIPKDTKMGDFAFPCFPLAKELKKAPQMIAKELQERASSIPNEIKSLQATGPYLNFFINSGALAADLIPKILSGDFHEKKDASGNKTMIEYSQPNTHKGFHVGHTRNVSLGDSLVRLREWYGDEVVAANYIGDVGTHIAKCLWYYKKSGAKYEDYQNQMSRGEFLGMLYAKADQLMDFSNLSRCPVLNVISVKIKNVSQHPKEKKWQVVQVTDGISQYQVVTAAKGFKENDLVALAKVGARIKGKTIELSQKKDIDSQGMLLSPYELDLGEDQENLYVFKEKIELGKEIADIFQIDTTIESASKEMASREREVSEILQKLENEDPETYKLWQETKEWSMQDFYEIYDWLGARFDHYFYESEVAKEGKELVKEYLEKGVFKKDQGAIGVDLSPYKLPFFLVLKSDGTGLYSTKDLALAKRKFDEFGVDLSIYVVDASQTLHFQQVFKTLELMGYERAKHCYHLSYGTVMLPEGKMSSRKGNVILLSQLKKMLSEQIYNDFLKAYEDKWSKDEIEEAIRRISIATIKYGMLNQDSGKNITFNIKEWSARTGNTGPYLMYAYARTQSILREVDQKYDLNEESINWDLLNHEMELKLINKLAQYTSTAEKAAERYEPQILCIYLYELSKDFSRMYDHCSVLHAENERLRNSRRQLIASCGSLLRSGLKLLGIPTLERM